MPLDHSSTDTIAAIATPYGTAGIGIVRMSGPLAAEIVQKIFKPKRRVEKRGVKRGVKRVVKRVEDLENHRLYLGHLIDPSSGATIDEVLLAFMKAPHSYTREDVVEINSHSGHFLISKILQVILDQGARLAKPGEFTFRAFINGRIDLTQAEAIVDLINAKSEKGLLSSSRQIKGAFRSEIEGLRRKVIDILARTEVAIDFPEEEEGIISREEMAPWIEKELIAPIEKIIAAHAQRKVWMNGVDTVIVGGVNVGKSSLLNRLLDEERAIVTPVPGTTRDIIESMIYIEGIPLRLMDTAGIRDVEGEVERIGIHLARQKFAEADLSLIVIDRNRPLDEEDIALIAGSDKKRSLILINKTDLPSRLDEEELERYTDGVPLVKISALTGEGIDHLRRVIRDRVLSGDIDAAASHLIPNLRQRSVLEDAATLLKDAASNMADGLPLEIVAVDLKGGLDALGEITGETTDEAVLERIFSQFCLGK